MAPLINSITIIQEAYFFTRNHWRHIIGFGLIYSAATELPLRYLASVILARQTNDTPAALSPELIQAAGFFLLGKILAIAVTAMAIQTVHYLSNAQHYSVARILSNALSILPSLLLGLLMKLFLFLAAYQAAFIILGGLFSLLLPNQAAFSLAAILGLAAFIYLQIRLALVEYLIVLQHMPAWPAIQNCWALLAAQEHQMVLLNLSILTIFLLFLLSLCRAIIGDFSVWAGIASYLLLWSFIVCFSFAAHVRIYEQLTSHTTIE